MLKQDIAAAVLFGAAVRTIDRGAVMTEDLTWEFSKRPLSNSEIVRVERLIGYKLPLEYKDIMKEHHGARPSKKRFNSRVREGMMIKTFLPITEEYKVNLISVKEWIKAPAIMVPFANTPDGDYICFDYFSPENSPAIVVWNHEKREKEFVCLSFTTFLKDLY